MKIRTSIKKRGSGDKVVRRKGRLVLINPEKPSRKQSQRPRKKNK